MRSAGLGRFGKDVMTGAAVARLGATLLAAANTTEAADVYPSRSVTVVVPFPAGGPSDVVARILTDQMAKTLHQALVVETSAGPAACSDRRG
jgi:tripartite-type tricarboxylate transporter receptor subunit TctC